MRLYEFASNDRRLNSVLETATAGGTSAGSIASLPTAGGSVIRRIPTEPNLFGYISPSPPKQKKKHKKSS